MKSKNKPIIVSISGGCVSAVQNIPKGQLLIVRDYDIDGSEEDLQKDEDGRDYHEIPFKSDW